MKKNYALAELVEVMDESPFRTDVFDCEFMEKGCGGCQYGCIDYGAQLKLKQSQVREKLQRPGGYRGSCSHAHNGDETRG